MIQVTWQKCGDDRHWCSFDKLRLDNLRADGVYIVWHGGSKPRVVYVGQGDVADRIAKHRNDPRITHYRRYGGLYVTWASVPRNQQDSVERHLADRWNPLVGVAHPEVRPLAVNSPF